MRTIGLHAAVFGMILIVAIIVSFLLPLSVGSHIVMFGASVLYVAYLVIFAFAANFKKTKE